MPDISLFILEDCRAIIKNSSNFHATLIAYSIHEYQFYNTDMFITLVFPDEAPAKHVYLQVSAYTKLSSEGDATRARGRLTVCQPTNVNEL